MSNRVSYKVKLDIFEGPLDLLLHLIKKDEVEIADISILDITEQYLSYLDLIKSMNLDIAGEFLLMAATLIHVKSKMLLPVTEVEAAEEEEGEDPREALIRKLMEYQRFKEVAAELSERNILGRDVFTRGAPFPLADLDQDYEEPSSLIDITLMDLMEAFKDILKRASAVHEIDITVDRFKVRDKINHIMETLDTGKSMVFAELFPKEATKGEVIVTFLAILELAKLLIIKVHQGKEEDDEKGTIRVYRSPGTEASTFDSPDENTHEV
ncbi:MAG: segregation/condensation protein A [Deltaproteobacteria bacterium]|nr:segregation/condensation protein A [Deltaproteobacteria bacterium]